MRFAAAVFDFNGTLLAEPLDRPRGNAEEYRQ